MIYRRFIALLVALLGSTSFAQTLPTFPHTLVFPNGPNGHSIVFGAQILGDVDGDVDGVNDFTIDEHATPSRSPHVYVYSGADLTELLDLTVTTLDFSGYSRAVGDVDGNGLADFSTIDGLYCGLSGGMFTPASAFPHQPFVPSGIGNIDGVPGDEILLAQVGMTSTDVFAYDASGNLIYQVNVPNTGDVTMSGIEDLDGDGVNDFVVAVAENYFAPILAPPPPAPTDTGWVGVFSGIDGTLLQSFTGGLGARLGGGIAVAPDITGDGVADILVYAPHGPSLTTPNAHGGRGQIHIICGATLTMSVFWNCFGSCGNGSLPTALNRSIHLVRDYDGDGTTDFVIGQSIYPYHSGRTGAYIGWHGNPLARELGDLDGDGFVEMLAIWPTFGFTGLHPQIYSAKPEAVEAFGTPSCNWNWPETPQIGATCDGQNFSLDFETGAVVTVNGSGIPPSSRGLLMIGLSDSQWGPLSLPFDLSNAGLPGCELLVSPDIFVRVPSQTHNGKTFLTRDFVVPPVMAGTDVFCQWLVFDPIGGPPFLAMSRGMKVTFE